MPTTRDYERWHEAYDDPASDLSWRLGFVQRHLRQVLDRTLGPLRLVSSCAGDARDVLGVLVGRDDAERVDATLLEIHPVLAERARSAAAGLAAKVTVRQVDAGDSDAYLGAVPADLVLLVGIFGNISDEDVRTTVEAAPQLCQPGATVIWSRSREREDLNDDIRAWFDAGGFIEVDYRALDRGGRPAVGVVRFDGDSQPLVPGRHWFTFRQ